MNATNRKRWLVIGIILGVILIDQASKIAVKTSMCLHERIAVCGDWFYILFTENDGMAFGMELFSKWFLTSFRIVAVVLIAYYLHRLIKRGARSGYIACLAFILAGALGNLIDCLFYGLIFSESLPLTFWNQDPATFVPFGTGYSTWFLGKVVDMFYFPLIETTWPSWVPLLGGKEFVFFAAIFNVADAVLSCSFVVLILFFRKEWENMFNRVEKKEAGK